LTLTTRRRSILVQSGVHDYNDSAQTRVLTGLQGT
jgi:hypothetical protein